MSAAKESKSRQPWRDNIEAMTVAIIMAVMFKYFALEAYQIPTGSMQPTLMGQDFEPEPPGTPKSWYVKLLDAVLGPGGSIKDRILVDKLSFHYRDPKRWEVVVFKYPLNRAQNFVKRLVGMPSEQLRIQNGDLWNRVSANEPWQHLRRPPAVLNAQLKALDVREPSNGVHWAVEPESTGKVVAQHRSCTVDGDVALRFVAHGGGPILDTYSHGYPAGMQEHLPQKGRSSQNEVGDLRAAGRIRARAGLESFVIELRETGHSYEFEIPGPAAPASSTPRVSSEAKLGAPSPIAEKLASAYRLPADRWVRFSAQNIDDLLTLVIDGENVAELEIAPCDGSAKQSGVLLHLARGGAELDDLQVWRDIHYTPSFEFGDSEWLIPKDSYFMLGDNTQDSSDSREWRSVDLAWNGMPAGTSKLPGNSRGQRNFQNNNPADANPIERRMDRDVYTFFRDVWGELWIFNKRDELQVQHEMGATGSAPFVARNLITGRAVAVFWPLSIKYSTYRWKWVR